MKKATRYKIANEGEGYPRYLAIYEFESRDAFNAYSKSPELAAAREEMGQTWKERKFDVKWRVQFEAIRTWER